MEKNKRLAAAVSEALDSDVDVREGPDGTQRVTVRALTRQPPFAAVWMNQGWPADVHQTLERFPHASLVVAPRFSPGAREALDERGVNWIDETGGAHVRAKGLIVRLDGQRISIEPPPARPTWSRTALAAAEAVLVEPPQRIQIAWVAANARCSPARASAILRGWDEAGWTAKRGAPRGRGAYRTLEQPNGLLSGFAEHLNAMPIERSFAHGSSRDLEDLARRIGESVRGLDCAWTGWAAAEQLAPFVSQLPVLHLRVSERVPRRTVQERLRAVGVVTTEQAGRVELWRSPEAAFQRTTWSSFGSLMSWPRVYADLRRLGGRGDDAAEQLRDVMRLAA